MAAGLVELTLLAGLVIALVIAYQLFFKAEQTPYVDEVGVEVEETQEEAEGTPMTILYGSQTGTAEEFAEEFAKEAKRNGYRPTVHDLEDYDHAESLPQESLAVLMLSTFGEGDPSDSAQGFDDWLKAEKGDRTLLEGVDFAVFALGNKQYEKFCEMGKRCDKFMTKMGAKRILACGIGDDDESIEDNFIEWKQKFFDAANALYGRETSMVEVVFQATWTVDIQEAKQAKEYEAGYKRLPDAKDNIEMSYMRVNRELRQDTSDGGSTKHVEFDISDLSVSYVTADNLGICPRNDHKTAAKLAKRIGVRSNTVFSVSSKSSKHTGLPSPCNVMDALLWYLDINSPPKKALISTLAGFAEDPKEATEMKSLCSPSNKAEYEKVVMSGRMTLLAFLERYKSIKVSLSAFLEICPKMQPRYYTISSSSNAQPDRITITMSVLEMGVCTNYLDRLKPDKDLVPIFVRPSTFRLPKQISVPIIMVGPGTGLAPFMGFVQEFEHRRTRTKQVLSGERVLFFGCKKQTQDFIYKEELSQAQKEGVLTEFHTAFSREGKEKVYVQHLMAKEGKDLWKYLSNGGFVYVCGGTAMGRDVKETILKVTVKYGGKTEKEASAFIDKLHTDGRYVQELWSV